MLNILVGMSKGEEGKRRSGDVQDHAIGDRGNRR